MESKNLPALPFNRTPPQPEAPARAPAAPTPPVLPSPTAAPSVPPAILSGRPNVWHLLGAFRRRWRLAVSLGLLVGAMAAVVTYFLASPSSYTATSLLRVDSTKPQILFV